MKVFGVFDPDFVWTLSPLAGFLWAAGGSGQKLFRRIGVPFAISVYGLGYGLGNFFLLSALFLSIFAVSTLPYGTRMKKKLKWAYPVYLYFVGFLYGASLWALGIGFWNFFEYLLSLLVCSFVFGTFVFLSQKIDFPKWKWVEILTGSALGGSAAWIIVS